MLVHNQQHGLYDFRVFDSWVFCFMFRIRFRVDNIFGCPVKLQLVVVKIIPLMCILNMFIRGFLVYWIWSARAIVCVCVNGVAHRTHFGRIIQFGMECVLKCSGGGCSILVYEIALFEIYIYICRCVSRGCAASILSSVVVQRFANIVKRRHPGGLNIMLELFIASKLVAGHQFSTLQRRLWVVAKLYTLLSSLSYLILCMIFNLAQYQILQQSNNRCYIRFAWLTIVLNISNQFNAVSPYTVCFLTIITAVKFIVPTLLLFFFVVRTRLSVCGIFRFASLAHEAVRTPTKKWRKKIVFNY